MAKQHIQIGDSGTVAKNKINGNFDEVYEALLYVIGKRFLNLRGFGDVWLSQSYRDSMSPIKAGDLWVQSRESQDSFAIPPDQAGYLGDGFPPEPPTATVTWRNGDWFVALVDQTYTAGGLTQFVLTDRTKWYRIPLGKLYDLSSVSDNAGEEVVSFGYLFEKGDVQKSEYLLTAITTDDAVTVMESPQRPVLRKNQLHNLTIDISAVKMAELDKCEKHVIEVVVSVKDDGTADIYSTHRAVGTTEDTSVNVTTETNGGICYLNIRLTGIDDNEVRWIARIEDVVMSTYVEPT